MGFTGRGNTGGGGGIPGGKHWEGNIGRGNTGGVAVGRGMPVRSLQEDDTDDIAVG